MFKTGARLQYDKNTIIEHIKTLGFTSGFWGKGYILDLSSQTHISVR